MHTGLWKAWVDDLLIESKHGYTVVEFKNLQINYLVLKGGSRTNKAKRLVAMSLTQILELRINSKHHPRGMEEWLEGEVRQQLRSYVTGAAVRANGANKTFRAYAVVIIGARHILIRDMDREGEWIGDWRLTELR